MFRRHLHEMEGEGKKFEECPTVAEGWKAKLLTKLAKREADGQCFCCGFFLEINRLSSDLVVIENNTRAGEDPSAASVDFQWPIHRSYLK